MTVWDAPGELLSPERPFLDHSILMQFVEMRQLQIHIYLGSRTVLSAACIDFCATDSDLSALPPRNRTRLLFEHRREEDSHKHVSPSYQGSDMS